jgi:hypothetical protein
LDSSILPEAKELAATMSIDGLFSNSPVTKEAFIARSRLWAGVVVIAGLLTSASGVAVALRHRWGIYGSVAAALLVLGFPLVTRLFLPRQYQFSGPDLVDVAIASMIGLTASLGFMFRPARSSPN